MKKVSYSKASAIFRKRRPLAFSLWGLPGDDYYTAGRYEAKEPKTWYNTVNQEGWSGMDE
jgi:hypothetical protein